MFSLGSTDDTFPLPGTGMTMRKLVFPLKEKLATCTGENSIYSIFPSFCISAWKL